MPSRYRTKVSYRETTVCRGPDKACLGSSTNMVTGEVGVLNLDRLHAPVVAIISFTENRQDSNGNERLRETGLYSVYWENFCHDNMTVHIRYFRGEMWVPTRIAGLYRILPEAISRRTSANIRVSDFTHNRLGKPSDIKGAMQQMVVSIDNHNPRLKSKEEQTNEYLDNNLLIIDDVIHTKIPEPFIHVNYQYVYSLARYDYSTQIYLGNRSRGMARDCTAWRLDEMDKAKIRLEQLVETMRRRSSQSVASKHTPNCEVEVIISEVFKTPAGTFPAERDATRTLREQRAEARRLNPQTTRRITTVGIPINEPSDPTMIRTGREVSI